MIRLSSVLVSHFLLDLQEVHQRKAIGLATSDALRTSQNLNLGGQSIDFANHALGSLGATIDSAHYFGREPGEDDGCTDDLGVDNILNDPEGEPSTQDSRIEDEPSIMEVRRAEFFVAAIEV